ASQEADDPRVIQLGHGSGLAPEAANVIRDSGHLRSEDLHRHRHLVGDARAAEHLAHSPLADALVDDETVQLGERRLVRRRLCRGLRRSPGRRRRRGHARLPPDLEAHATVPAARQGAVHEQAHVAANVTVRTALHGALLHQRRLRSGDDRLGHVGQCEPADRSGKFSAGRGYRIQLYSSASITRWISTGASRFFTLAGGSASSTNFSFPARAAHSSEITTMSSRATPQSREARFTPAPRAGSLSARAPPTFATTPWPACS